MKKCLRFAFVFSITVLFVSVAATANDNLLKRAGTAIESTLQRVIDEVELARKKHEEAEKVAKKAEEEVKKADRSIKSNKKRVEALKKDLITITTGVTMAEAELEKAGESISAAKLQLKTAKEAVTAANKRANPYADEQVRNADKFLLEKIADQCKAADALKKARAAVRPTRRRLEKEFENELGNWDKLKLVDAIKLQISALEKEITDAELKLGSPAPQTATMQGPAVAAPVPALPAYDTDGRSLYTIMEEAQKAAKEAKDELEAAEARLEKATDTLNGGEVRDGIRDLKAKVGEVKTEVIQVGTKVDKTNELLVLIDGKVVDVKLAIETSTTKLTEKIDEKFAKPLAETGAIPVETEGEQKEVIRLLTELTQKFEAAKGDTATEKAILTEVASLKADLLAFRKESNRRITGFDGRNCTWYALEPGTSTN